MTREERSSHARRLILGRIGEILGRRPDAAVEYQQIDREYRQGPSLEPGMRLDLFVERLEHYQVGVYRCDAAALPQTIGEVLRSRRKASLVVPRDVPRVWLPPELRVVEDDDLDYAALDRTEGVLTGCSVAVASTGTIVLTHRRAEGRRAVTLVPDYHLSVVFEDQVVQTVPEAIRQLAAWNPALVTTISGPSATADIEMTRIRGVHGPRTLDVVLVRT